MIRKDASRLALVVVAIAAAGAMGAGRAVADMRVVSSDFTSRFLAIGVSKSIVVELSADVKSVVVADRTIATAVALSKRRVEVIGAGLGQTNIFFFDDHDRPLGGLDVAVKDTTQPHGLEDYPYPASVVMVVYGWNQHLRHCAAELHADQMPRCAQARGRSTARHREHQHQQQRSDRRDCFGPRPMTAFARRPLQS